MLQNVDMKDSGNLHIYSYVTIKTILKTHSNENAVLCF